MSKRANVQAVSMDMWPAHINATAQTIPKAADKIVFDRFHIMAHVSKAVDQVRRRENKVLQGLGDDTLKRSKYLWLRNASELDEAAQQRSLS